MTPKLMSSKFLVALLIAFVIGITVWMHWESIREKLMPDYGTDPYTVGGACKPSK